MEIHIAVGHPDKDIKEQLRKAVMNGLKDSGLRIKLAGKRDFEWFVVHDPKDLDY